MGEDVHLLYHTRERREPFWNGEPFKPLYIRGETDRTVSRSGNPK